MLNLFSNLAENKNPNFLHFESFMSPFVLTSFRAFSILKKLSEQHSAREMSHFRSSLFRFLFENHTPHLNNNIFNANLPSIVIKIVLTKLESTIQYLTYSSVEISQNERNIHPHFLLFSSNQLRYGPIARERTTIVKYK